MSDSHREDDAALIQACIAGDERAWRRFVDRFGRGVYAVPRRLGLPGEAADDVFQAVFSIVVRELPNLRSHAGIARWLLTIAHHESYRWMRQSRRDRDRLDAFSAAQPPSEGVNQPDVDLARLEQRLIVHQGLDELGGSCRELLTALFLEDPPAKYRDIAHRLGVPIGAIGPTRNRCLAKLLDIIGNRVDDMSGDGVER